MNDEQTRAAVIHGVAGLAGGILLWWLSSALGWPTPVFVLVLLVVLGVVGASAVRTLWKNGQQPEPPPVAPPRPVVVAPIPPASTPIGPVAIASADAAYRFSFTATVNWNQEASGSLADQSRRSACAQEALLDRAIDVARTITPNDHTAATHRLAAALSEPCVASGAAVRVWASDVRVTLTGDDVDRLTRLEQIQKDVRLWEQERAHEREVRRYLGEDVLASSGTALVWWLARHEDDIRGAVELISDLTRISAVAQGRPSEPTPGDDRTSVHPEGLAHTDVGRGVSSAADLANGRRWHTTVEPSTPADAARNLLDGLFPDDADRVRAARHLALLVEAWGQRDLARSLGGGDGDPGESSWAAPGDGRPGPTADQPGDDEGSGGYPKP